jgi:hypothetical protein
MKGLFEKVRALFAKLWPKRRDSEERCCWNCKHTDLSYYSFPCCVCDSDNNAWEPKK